ncbi:MAG: hypothetical protein ACFB2Y_09820 [Fulvivirga sp.]
MKIVSKKKINSEKAAKAFIENKYGKAVELVKPHRSRWLFRFLVSGVKSVVYEVIGNTWQEFLKDFKAKNTGIPHVEAMKAASKLYKALKA